jgi:hypothetical protein
VSFYKKTNLWVQFFRFLLYVGLSRTPTIVEATIEGATITISIRAGQCGDNGFLPWDIVPKTVMPYNVLGE